MKPKLAPGTPVIVNGDSAGLGHGKAGRFGRVVAGPDADGIYEVRMVVETTSYELSWHVAAEDLVSMGPIPVAGGGDFGRRREEAPPTEPLVVFAPPVMPAQAALLAVFCSLVAVIAAIVGLVGLVA